MNLVTSLSLEMACELAANIVGFDVSGLFLVELCKVVSVNKQTEHDEILTR